MRKWQLLLVAGAALAAVSGCGGITSGDPTKFAYVLVNSNQLRTINLFTGNAISSSVNLSASIDDIAVRPTDGQLFGLGSDLKLYEVSPVNGTCTAVSSAPLAITGTNGGLTFQTTTTLKFMTSGGHNYRIDATTGNLTATDPDTATQVNGLAENTSTGNFYAYDAASDQLFVTTDPNGGVFTLVGPSGKDMSGNVGLAVDSTTGKGYVVGAEGLFQVNLSTGAFAQISAAVYEDIAITP